MNPESSPSFRHITARDAAGILAINPLMTIMYMQGCGTILDVNATFEKKLMIHLADIKGISLRDAAFIPENDRETVAEKLSCPDPTLTDREMTMLNSRGETLHLRVTTSPVTVEGTPCMIALAIDVTDMMSIGKKLENKHDELEATNEELMAAVDELERTNDELTTAYWELKESENRLRTFFDENLDGIVIIDHFRKILSCNTAFSSMLGYSDPSDLKDVSITDITPAEYREMEDNIFEEGLKRGEMSDFYAKEYIRRDGTRIPVSIQTWFLKDKTGGISSTWSIVRDQSGNSTNGLSIGETLKLVETAIKELPVAVIISEADSGKFILVNDVFEKTSGYSRQEAIGKTAEDLNLFTNPADRQRIFRQAKFNSRGVPISVSFTLRGGQTLFCLVSSNFINLRSRNLLLLAIQDITPLHDMEIQREKIQNQMSHIQKMEAIGTLAGGLAHDFNNILGGIVGSLELIRRVVGREQITQRDALDSYINTALSSCNRATDLTRQLLSLTRKSEMQMMPVDLCLSLKHVAKLCSGSFPKSVDIRPDIPSSPIRILADPTAIEQVLINLCVNASQAMTEMRQDGERQGGILTMSASMFCPGDPVEEIHPDMDMSRTYARITIEDSGVGMPADIVPRIFDPFFTTRQRQKGTGLGLTTAYNTIKQHGGFITVRSTPGRGTSFSVYIPAIQDVCIEQRPDEVTPLEKGTILIIDDEKELLAITAEMLSLCGYEPLTAERAEDGIRIFRERHGSISGVILDMSMPGMSGLEVFIELKKIDPGLRVLLASGYGMMEQVETAMKEGAGGFLNKPFSMSDLTTKLKSLLCR